MWGSPLKGYMLQNDFQTLSSLGGYAYKKLRFVHFVWHHFICASTEGKTPNQLFQNINKYLQPSLPGHNFKHEIMVNFGNFLSLNSIP